MKSKFVIGDKVKVVNYGSLMWVNKKSRDYEVFWKDTSYPVLNEKEGLITLDWKPELVGMVGIVRTVSASKDIEGNIINFSYSLSGIKEKAAWYDEIQLEMVNANPNRE